MVLDIAAGGGKPRPFYVADIVKLPGYSVLRYPPWLSCVTPTGCFLVASGLMASDDLLSVRSFRPAPNPACAFEGTSWKLASSGPIYKTACLIKPGEGTGAL